MILQNAKRETLVMLLSYVLELIKKFKPIEFWFAMLFSFFPNLLFNQTAHWIVLRLIVKGRHRSTKFTARQFIDIVYT